MNNTSIAIYIPIFIMLLVAFSANSASKDWIVIKKQKGERGLNSMSEYLKKYVGEKCFVTTGSFGSSITGKIVAIEDKWIEIEYKENRPKEIINLEFVQRIRILNK